MIKPFKTSVMLLAAACSFVIVSCNNNDDEVYVDEGVENGHVWVDLGLSVKWATMNIGAITPLDCGTYFAWGETDSKYMYDWSTYYDSKDGSNFNKYNNNGGKTILELKDDAANINWGGSWRMPTRAELDELYNNCTWTWINKNGVKGYEVASKKDKHVSIFLPVTGYYYENSLKDAGSYGGYWSSSLGTSYSSDAYCLYFASDLPRWHGDIGRYYGRTIRAVCK